MNDDIEDETLITRDGWKVLRWEVECDEYVKLLGKDHNGKYVACRFYRGSTGEYKHESITNQAKH